MFFSVGRGMSVEWMATTTSLPVWPGAWECNEIRFGGPRSIRLYGALLGLDARYMPELSASYCEGQFLDSHKIGARYIFGHAKTILY